MKDNDEDKKVSLEDYIIPQKIKAFVNAYAPSTESMAEEMFTDAKLREFFKSYVTSLGDPLSIYLDRLEQAGFVMGVTFSGEPALFVTRKIL